MTGQTEGRAIDDGYALFVQQRFGEILIRCDATSARRHRAEQPLAGRIDVERTVRHSAGDAGDRFQEFHH